MEQQTPQTAVRNETRAGEALSVRRLFTQPGVHPFDTVEWELRDARIGSVFEQKRRRVPVDLVAERDQHRRPEVLPRPARLTRARALRQADGRARRGHDRRLGPPARLLRLRRGRRHVRVRAELHPAAPDGGVQLAGLVQRRVRGEPSVQCVPAVPRADLDARGNGPDRRARRGRAGRARGLRRRTAITRDRRGQAQRPQAGLPGHAAQRPVRRGDGRPRRQGGRERRTAPQWLRVDELRLGHADAPAPAPREGRRRRRACSRAASALLELDDAPRAGGRSGRGRRGGARRLAAGGRLRRPVREARTAR